jgi:chromosome segregation protein
VDAALDETNSIRFASIVEKLSTKTQFIVITHNRATMNKANIIYGVTMSDDGASKLLSIDMAEAEKVVNR